MRRVAVCLPAWNGERFLAAQLGSILADLPPDARVLVRDDGSTDRTTEIVTQFAERDARVEMVPGGERLGVVGSVERLLGAVQGGAVLLSDQDDLWRPGRTARCLAALEHADLVVHDAARIDASGEPLGDTLFQRRGFGGGVLANIWRNRFTGCCMAFRAELLEAALPFPPRIPMHDQWLGLAALRRGRVEWLPEVLLDYRVHADNATATGGARRAAGIRQRLAWRLDLLRAMPRWLRLSKPPRH